MFNASNSPLGLAQKIDELMRLPQSLCHQCGWSCRMVTFKGLMNVSQMEKIVAETENIDENKTIERVQIQTFLTLFQPYASQDEVEKIAPVFRTRVREVAVSKGQDPDQVSFFHCRYLQEDSRCGIYEDRPEGCRQYPVVHPNTIFHPGCGFEAQSKQNWIQIQEILDKLGLDDRGHPKSTC